MERVAGGVEAAGEQHARSSQPGVPRPDQEAGQRSFPQSPKDVTVMQRRLIRAGIRNRSALKMLYGAKVVLAILLPV